MGEKEKKAPSFYLDERLAILVRRNDGVGAVLELNSRKRKEQAKKKRKERLKPQLVQLIETPPSLRRRLRGLALEH